MSEGTQALVASPQPAGRPPKSHYEDFLRAYFDPDSPTCGKASESGLAVGISPRGGRKCIEKFHKQGPTEKIKHVFRELGLTEWYWAKNVQAMVNSRDNSGNPTSASVEGTKILGKVLGVVVPDAVQVQQVTQNINSGQVMIVVGANEDRFKQLEAGAIESEVVEQNAAP